MTTTNTRHPDQMLHPDIRRLRSELTAAHAALCEDTSMTEGDRDRMVADLLDVVPDAAGHAAHALGVEEVLTELARIAAALPSAPCGLWRLLLCRAEEAALAAD